MTDSQVKRVYERELSPWVENYVNKVKNSFIFPIYNEYMEDSFNLYGLQNYCVSLRSVMNIILAKKRIVIEDDSDFETANIDDKAEEIYCLIHQRFLMTDVGMNLMYKRYCYSYYGKCPCIRCERTPLIPTGLKNDCFFDTVKLFCPCCKEIYVTCAPYDQLDGAFFGTSFCHVFFLTYPELIPSSIPRCVPSIFGFAIHPSSPYYLKSEEQKKINE